MVKRVINIEKEQVDHPDHYGGEDNPFEVIKVLEDWLTADEFIGALKFNIYKYLAQQWGAIVSPIFPVSWEALTSPSKIWGSNA